MKTERLLMGLLLGGIAVGCAIVLRPFFSAILWAAILTFTTWPAYQWVRRHLPLGRYVAAGVMVTLAAVLIVLPLAFAVPEAGRDVTVLRVWAQGAWQAGLPPAPAWVFDIPLIGQPLGDLWSSWANDLSVMVSFFQPYFGTALELALSVLLAIGNGIVQALLSLFVGFFFYASGDRLAGGLTTLLHRIAGDQAQRLISVTGATIRGVVYGLLGTAIVQGVLTMLGLWAAGIPRPILLGIVAGSMSVLPIGAPVVWIPAALWLVNAGHVWQGALLFAYGVVFITGSDNVIRPYFIARGAQLPVLLSVLGVLGGALAYGLLGIFVGPVLLGVAYTLVREWARAPDPVPVSLPVLKRRTSVGGD